MPLIALIAMQYGSYFQATSHDRVFTSVTSKVMARFIDYTITFTQFCISFVMLAGAGANLNQQFGTPLWFGSALMAVAVIICGFFNVEKVTNILGSITPFIVVLLVIISIHSYLNPQRISELPSSSRRIMWSPRCLIGGSRPLTT